MKKSENIFSKINEILQDFLNTGTLHYDYNSFNYFYKQSLKELNIFNSYSM